MNGYNNQYQQNQILFASPEHILLMLYDGAIRFGKQARIACKNENLALKLEKISKVFAIVTEFSNSLNHQIGGEIAADLDGLYQFMLRELGKARVDNTGKHLQTVIELLEGLRETWAQAIEINRAEQAMLAENQQNDHAYESKGKQASISAAG